MTVKVFESENFLILATQVEKWIREFSERQEGMWSKGGTRYEKIDAVQWFANVKDTLQKQSFDGYSNSTPYTATRHYCIITIEKV